MRVSAARHFRAMAERLPTSTKVGVGQNAPLSPQAQPSSKPEFSGTAGGAAQGLLGSRVLPPGSSGLALLFSRAPAALHDDAHANGDQSIPHASSFKKPHPSRQYELSM